MEDPKPVPPASRPGRHTPFRIHMQTSSPLHRDLLKLIPQPSSAEDLEGRTDPLPRLILPSTGQNEPLRSEDYAALTQRDLTPKERELAEDPITQTKARKEHARRVLKAIFHDPVESLADLTPYRIRTAWRLVREMARHRGFITPDQMLIEGLEPMYDPLDLDKLAPLATPVVQEAPDIDEPIVITTGLVIDKWIYPLPWQKPKYDNKNPHMRLFESVVIDMRAAEQINENYCPYQWVTKEIYPAGTDDYETATKEVTWLPHHYNGVALLPPEIPLPCLDENGEPRDNYDPRNPSHDPALHAYIHLLRTLANCLYIDLGSKEDRQSGAKGLSGLFDPVLIRASFPSRVQIMTWEAVIVEESLDKIVHHGMPKAKTMLKDKYGFQDIEIQQLFKMAKMKAMTIAQSDVEEDRGLMILRLEDVARRAKDNLDIRAELAAYKTLAVVTGVTRVEPTDLMSEFVNVVRDVSATRKSIDIPPSARALPD